MLLNIVIIPGDAEEGLKYLPNVLRARKKWRRKKSGEKVTKNPTQTRWIGQGKRHMMEVLITDCPMEDMENHIKKRKRVGTEEKVNSIIPEVVLHIPMKILS